MFANFFIHRPVFAVVISLVILLAGGLSIGVLPIAQYPEITPPTVKVSAQYTGADAKTVEETVATPIEQEVNGAEDMLYMVSRSTSDGRMALTVTFKVGTDLDLRTVDVQNRVSRATAKLPDEVNRAGITVKKQSTDMLLVISLYSPDNSYDTLFLSNYGSINLLDDLSRIPGVGLADIVVGKQDYSMRLWLQPERLAGLGLTASDVAQVIKEQNVQAPAGAIGQPPAPKGTEYQYAVNVKGRLTEPSEFENIIVRTLPDGSIVRVQDVARTELGAQDYTSFGRLNGSPAVLIVVYQMPGANALDTADAVKAKMIDKAKLFPPGVQYQLSYDNTKFVVESIREVLKTLFEALLLVLLVVFIFLGNFRATLIPMLAIPVSLIGTFGAFVALGFSINTLTMFGLVLAIGIVVDDAIVVVEAVEHYIEKGHSPIEATEKAMGDVSGPVIAIALVLSAVFVPVAFLGGITGELYRQFALTLSVSVLLSALVALTLTPALCAMLLKPRKRMRGPLGWALRGFNTLLERTTNGYQRWVRSIIRRSAIALACLVAVGGGIIGLIKILPTGFVPDEDLGYFMVSVMLPSGASLERTDAVLRKAEKILQKAPGVESVITFGGLNIINSTYTSNNASIFAVLKDWEERKSPRLQSAAIVQEVQKKLLAIPEAIVVGLNPPPISGLGSTGGVQFELQDRTGREIDFLAKATQGMMMAMHEQKSLTGLFTSFSADVPQIRLNVDRDKVKTLGIPVDSLFQSLQIFLGSLYVNQFNKFGRTYRVYIQAEPGFRATPDAIGQIYVRTGDGKMAPLSTLTSIESMSGPDTITRYNLYRTAEINASPAPGFSSGQTIGTMEKLAAATLPEGAGYEWTGTAYQEKIASGQQGMIFVLALIFVFLFLAALYESWAIPFAVILGIPLGVFGAFFAQWLRGLTNDVYAQIGLIMLIGLAAKNAILIVEFAKMRHEEGLAVAEAALEAARLRFRPILMTSFAFILGVVPLVVASGAGSASRHSLGTAVFGGMLAATCLGVFIIPVLYVVIQRLSDRINDSPERVSEVQHLQSAEKKKIV